MQAEVLRIIEGGLSGDTRRVVNYSQRLADRYQSEGEVDMSRCIKEILDTRLSSRATMDQFMSAPVDSDSRLQMLEIIPCSAKRVPIVLNDIEQRQVDSFVSLVKRRDDLIANNVDIRASMILYGAPGCGKTSIAHYISEQTGLPLLIARLDSLISSLLGNTAKNIRRIFEYATSMPCILFLDEFDAIAKARDDAHELGELKRVINSLLQNIDSMADDSVLLAATNHPELLDRAVWRRFQMMINVGLPNDETRRLMIREMIGDFSSEFIHDEKVMGHIVELLREMSPSDIKTLINKTKANTILASRNEMTYVMLLTELYNMTQKELSTENLIRFLSDAGVSQTTISKEMNISLRQIKQMIHLS